MSSEYSITMKISECYEANGPCETVTYILRDDLLPRPDCPLFMDYYQEGKYIYMYIHTIPLVFGKKRKIEILNSVGVLR